MIDDVLGLVPKIVDLLPSILCNGILLILIFATITYWYWNAYQQTTVYREPSQPTNPIRTPSRNLPARPVSTPLHQAPSSSIESPEPAIKIIQVLCPYCRKSIGKTDLMKCSYCPTQYHKDCYDIIIAGDLKCLDCRHSL